jgi:hypothetical protein
MDDSADTPRLVIARRTLMLGTAAAAMAGAGAALGAGAEGEGGEGEGGEGATIDPGIALARDLGMSEGHLRAARALTEAGQDAAAAAHLDAARALVAALGPALAAAGHDAPVPDGAAGDQAAFAAAVGALTAPRAALSPRDRLLAVAALMRNAAASYQAAFADGVLTDPPAYRAAWGMLRTAAAETEAVAGVPGAEGPAAAIADQVAVADGVFGGIDGPGAVTPDASVLYGAAARAEIAARRVPAE